MFFADPHIFFARAFPKIFPKNFPPKSRVNFLNFFELFCIFWIFWIFGKNVFFQKLQKFQNGSGPKYFCKLFQNTVNLISISWVYTPKILNGQKATKPGRYALPRSPVAPPGGVPRAHTRAHTRLGAPTQNVGCDRGPPGHPTPQNQPKSQASQNLKRVQIQKWQTPITIQFYFSFFKNTKKRIFACFCTFAKFGIFQKHLKIHFLKSKKTWKKVQKFQFWKVNFKRIISGANSELAILGKNWKNWAKPGKTGLSELE